MIFYNGATGSLGQCFAPALIEAATAGVSLRARLEDRVALRGELAAYAGLVKARAIWLVQMAAKVSVPACEQDPAAAHQTNVRDTLETVHAFASWARAQGAQPHVLYVSSGHVYATRADGQRIAESDPLAPRSVYAHTKLVAENALSEQAARDGQPLIIARVFGLLAPKQPANYMLPGLIRRVRQHDLAGVPGLSFYRDFLDARDVCRVLLQLCQQTQAASNVAADGDIVNLCSGEPVQLRSIVERLVQLIDPEHAVDLLATLSEAPGRNDDVPSIIGDPTRLQARLRGPIRTISLDQTLQDAVSDRG
jgi:nucleoside-diphosphate-sugar epimerase